MSRDLDINRDPASARRSTLRHVLIVPDGNRRHARRQFLGDLLSRSRADFLDAVSALPPPAVDRIEARVSRFLRDGIDPLGGRADDLDCDRIPVPLSYLRSSYRASGELLERIIRDFAGIDGLATISIYAMQRTNLLRRPHEIEAFLGVETAFQERWAGDAALLDRVRFRFVGEREAFAAVSEVDSLRDGIAAYLRSAERLERASRGRGLTVHLLAPYDYVWEINAAIRDGVFSPSRLAVAEEVDLVMRFGGRGRSIASGALPCQTAFSRFYHADRYFPDSSIGDVEKGLCAGDGERTRHGR